LEQKRAGKVVRLTQTTNPLTGLKAELLDRLASTTRRPDK